MASGAFDLPLARTPPRWLVRRARLLAGVGVGWHVLEATVAVGAGLAAGSIALVGFGADSLIEAVAGAIVLWRFAAGPERSGATERRAQRLIAASFFALAAYISVEASRSLVEGLRPEVSWVGIGLAAVTLAAMPPLAAAKSRVAVRLASSAAASEARQTVLCAYLSLSLLVGLGANALTGAWWLDPAAAMAIALIAAREGRRAWRGEATGCCEQPS